MNFGIAIKKARESRSLSQRQLAAKMSVSHSYISHIENGTREPSLKVLSGISKVLMTPLHVLALFAADEDELYGISPDRARTLAKLLMEETAMVQDGKM